MNKSQLIDTLAERLGCTKTDAAAHLNAFLDVVVESVADGDAVGISGFGSFEARDRGARTGRNPQTGEPMPIEARRAAHFKAGTRFKTALNV